MNCYKPARYARQISLKPWGYPLNIVLGVTDDIDNSTANDMVIKALAQLDIPANERTVCFCPFTNADKPAGA